MSENKNTPNFENIDQAREYVDVVREHYRQGHGEYRGRRNEDQQLIAEVTSDEARLIVDGVARSIINLGRGVSGKQPVDTLPEQDKPIAGDKSWNDFRSEYERLLVGFGVLTNRLHRDGYEVPSYADMQAEDRMKAASALFTDFLHHNALRFGVETAGVPKTDYKRRDTEEGGVEEVAITYDKDRAKSRGEIAANMTRRGFSTQPAAHQAGKISPEEYIRLRREFPEVDKDQFDNDVSFYTDVRGHYEETRE